MNQVPRTKSELPSTVLRIDPGQPQSAARRLCLFASFDPDSRVQETTLAYLAALQRAGCATIFVTTSATLAESDRKNLVAYCPWIIQRENRGYDFYSWKVALAIALDRMGCALPILLTNDSILGPLCSLEDVFAQIDTASDAVWGLTDSWETGEWHLQSYFLHIPASQISARWFKSFWETLEIKSEKDEIIRSYELGFSQAAQKSDVPCRAIIESKKVIARARRRGAEFQYCRSKDLDLLNVTLFMWDILIEEFGFPFIKAELLRQDRFASKAIQRWLEILPQETSPHVRQALIEFEETWMWREHASSWKTQLDQPQAWSQVAKKVHQGLKNIKHWREFIKIYRSKHAYVQTLRAAVTSSHDGKSPRFNERANFLFIGLFADLESGDGADLAWLMRSVMPQLRAQASTNTDVHAAWALSSSLQHRLSRASLQNFKLLRGDKPDKGLFDRYKALIIPARQGKDYRQRVLAAANRGLPVICSPQVAEACGWQNDRQCLVANVDNPNEFAEACRRIVTDSDLWYTLRDAARAASRDCLGDRL